MHTHSTILQNVIIIIITTLLLFLEFAILAHTHTIDEQKIKKIDTDIKRNGFGEMKYNL